MEQKDIDEITQRLIANKHKGKDVIEQNPDVELIEDGIYIFYIQDEVIYPVMMEKEYWEILQQMGNTIVGGPVQVINKPLGMAERWT